MDVSEKVILMRLVKIEHLGSCVCLMNIEFFGDEGNIGVIKILKNSLMNVS